MGTGASSVVFYFCSTYAVAFAEHSRAAQTNSTTSRFVPALSEAHSGYCLPKSTTHAGSSPSSTTASTTCLRRPVVSAVNIKPRHPLRRCPSQHLSPSLAPSFVPLCVKPLLCKADLAEPQQHQHRARPAARPAPA
ncbi:hypothetical protein BDW22DRAFT_247160 [Trametopsis cervina]|nr:hypothetical protein BDW22DRAFT_247160 [Trametopsis cervina]